MTVEQFEEVKESLIALLTSLIKSVIDLPVKQQMAPDQVDLINQRKSILQEIILNCLKLNENDITKMIISFFDAIKCPSPAILEYLKAISEELKEKIKQYTKDIIPRFLSICNLIKEDEIKLLFCETVGSVYGNLLLCLENKEYINMEQIIYNTQTIFQIINDDWQKNSSYESKKKSLWLLGILIKFLPKENIEKSIEGILREYVDLTRKQIDGDIVEGFIKVLERLGDENTPYFEEIVKGVLVSLNEQYQSPIFSSNYPFNPQAFQNKNNLLKLLQNLAIFNIDNTVDFFIHRHNSKDYVQKTSALWITNFLVSRNLTALSYQVKKQLISSLQNLVLDQDIEVKFVLCEIMLSMCSNVDFLEQINIDSSFEVDFILYFLVKQASIHDDEIKERNMCRSLFLLIL